MYYHMLAFVGGFLIDLLLGDPYWIPHPIRLIGYMISFLERKLLDQKNLAKRNSTSEFRRGLCLVFIVLISTVLTTAIILKVFYFLHPLAGMVVEMVMTYQILATKCLKVESMKVYRKLKEHDIEGARFAVSMIVGRDTNILNEEGIAKAAIETVAENTSDGVIAPMIYTAIGGPILGFCYKAINTMDSMIGYKNDRYIYFGKAAARLDDFVNFIPARISAMLMIIACTLSGKCFSTKNAVQIYRRDKYQHASPNSAHTEAVVAGALGIRLAGDASYFGKIVSKPYIGDLIREVTYDDIKRVNHLMLVTALICEMICMIGIWLCVVFT